MLRTLIEKTILNTTLSTTYTSGIIDLCGNNGGSTSEFGNGAVSLSLSSNFSSASGLTATLSYYIGNDKTKMILAQTGTAISANGNAYFGVVGIPTFRYFQWIYTFSGGSMTVSDTLLVKGEQ